MMRRYRKGELFRPPTAAESAAHADALEAFRRDPSKIPGQLLRGGDMIVKTPGGGIAGRSGTTIYSAACTRCVESSIADEKAILDTDEPVIVFNLDTKAVVGDAYIGTRLTQSGTRYYSCKPCGVACAYCIDNIASAEYQVDLSGVVNAACSQCDSWNDTYVLTQLSTCQWRWHSDPVYYCAPPTRRAVYLTMRSVGGGNYEASVQFNDVDRAVSAYFEKTYADLIPCTSWSAESFPLFRDETTTCDFSSATALVTAL